MDGVTVSGYGVDIAVYFAGDDKIYPGAWYVVYFGRGPVIFGGGDILSVASVKVFACDMASVCNRGQCVLLFRGAVRVHN